MVDQNIINGKVFLENGLVEAGLSIENGKIVTIGKTSSLPNADHVFDANGKIIIPGGTDVHTHILDLIYSYREDFETGTKAAASGGITTILEMPLGLEDKSTIDVFDLQAQALQKKSIVDFGIIGAAGYTNIDNIPALAKKGVVAFKTFMINPSEEEAELKNLAAINDYFLLKIFTEIAKTRLVSCVHAENDAIITHEMNRLISEGRVDYDAHKESRPPISEDEACQRAILLANKAKVRLNLVHMSSKGSFKIIERAKKRGCDISCEITPHHLFLNDKDGASIGPWAKVDPPLRSEDHVTAAWNSLNNGIIDIIASDHSPYSVEEKDVSLKGGNYFKIGSGTTGLETSLPILLDAINKNKISLKRVVQVISVNPAIRFGLYPEKGIIAINSDADLTIIDMKKEYTCLNEELFTKTKVSVFNGRRLKGRIEQTFVRGKLIYDNGFFPVEKGTGKFVKPLI